MGNDDERDTQKTQTPEEAHETVEIALIGDEQAEESIRRRVSGIYQIRNLHTGRVYIGKSRDIYNRWLAHRAALNRGLHINDELQGDWEIYGASAFVFTILEEVTGFQALQNAEAHHLAAADNTYNVIQVREIKETRLRPARTWTYTPEQFYRLITVEPLWEYLAEEWGNRGIKTCEESVFLNETIHHATFGITTMEHKAFKGLKSWQSLRDSLTNLELVLAGLAEVTSMAIHQTRDSQGFIELQRDTHEAGEVGGNARREVESLTRKPVVSPVNYKQLRQGRQRELQPPLLAAPETSESD